MVCGISSSGTTESAGRIVLFYQKVCDLLHLGYRLLQAHAQKDFTFFCVHETPMAHWKWVYSTTLKGYAGRDHYKVSYQ